MTLDTYFGIGETVVLGTHVFEPEAIKAFAHKFDPQPFHLDEQAGRDSMLGGLSASGWHTCAMMMRMMAESYILDSSSQGSTGVDFVNWLRPVRPGDILTGTARVRSRRLSPKRPTLGLAKIVIVVCNQRDEPVLESEYTLLLLTRAGVSA